MRMIMISGEESDVSERMMPIDEDKSDGFDQGFYHG